MNDVGAGNDGGGAGSLNTDCSVVVGLVNAGCATAEEEGTEIRCRLRSFHLAANARTSGFLSTSIAATIDGDATLLALSPKPTELGPTADRAPAVAGNRRRDAAFCL